MAERRSASRRSSSTCPRSRRAFSRRLHDAGVPVTPSARPRSPRRSRWCGRSAAGGCTGRRERCSSPTVSGAGVRPVFAAVFGTGRGIDRLPELDDMQSAPATADDRPPRRPAGATGPARCRWAGGVAPRRRRDRERGRHGRSRCRWRASDEEVLRDKRFDALEPDELAALYRLMSRLRAGDAAAAHPAGRAPPPRRAHRHAPHAAREPAHRRRSDPPGAPAAARRAPADGAAVRHLGLDGALRPRLPAVPDLRRRAAGTAGRGRGVRVRHPADPADPRAALAQPRAGDPARGRRGAGLVERHPDRRRAEGVQRPPRPARDGPRGGGRDPVRRLGARRPRARRPRDGAPARGWPTGSCGSTRGSPRPASPRGPAGWRRRCRTATRWSAATASRRSRRWWTRSAAPGDAGRELGRARATSPRRSRGRARRRCPGSSVAMPSGYGPEPGHGRRRDGVSGRPRGR